MSGNFLFQKWIFGGIENGNLILLDIRKDRYLLIPSCDVHCLSEQVESDLFEGVVEYNINMSSEAVASAGLIETLKREDVITGDPSKGKYHCKVNVDPPRDEFEHIQTDIWPTCRWYHYVIMVAAGLLAHIILKYTRFIDLKRFLALIKKNHNNYENVSGIIKISRIYYLLRPILWRSRVCLYDTTTFFIFCRFFGFSPTVVFGVTSDPFDAHCWAQYKGYILNDVPQNTCQYFPIMTI